MKHSESLKSIAGAIRKAQGAIEGALKEAANPFFKKNYADLESCWDAIKKPLQDNGLAIVQTMGFIPGAGTTLITTLIHESGEYITGEQPVCAKADDPQALGSAVTYARRYGLSAIIGLVQIDDDGESAKGRSEGSGSSKSANKANVISVAQRNRLFAIAGNVKIPDEEVKKILSAHGFESSKDITWNQYDVICKQIEDYKP